MTPQIQTRARNRRLSACYRHPAEPVTGFCASCLRERLAGICPLGDPKPSSSTSDGYANDHDSVGGGPSLANCRSKASGSSSYTLQELRHSRSVSAGKCEAFSGFSEQRRRSCEIKVRNTLADLFDIDDEKNRFNEEPNVGSKNLGFSRLTGSVVEKKEGENGEDIGVAENTTIPNVIVDNATDEEVEEELKPMKEFIDLELQTRKHNVRELKDIAGSFWEAASVFSKKLRKWRRNQKMKSRRHGRDVGRGGSDLLLKAVRKPRGRQFRDTQSEIGDYGFGRRSCDTEPRFSVDAGRSRISVDDPRISFDEPRASWDGYLVARTIPRLTPMLSVIKNGGQAPVNGFSGHQISEEENMDSIDENEMSSSGSAHANSDSSSSQRQSSFERSSSVKVSSKKTLGLEVDELKDWHKKASNVAMGDNSNGFEKFTRWHKVLGFTHKRGDKKREKVLENVNDHPVQIAEVCEKQARDCGGVGGDSNRKLIRSISWRNSSKIIRPARNCSNKGREECALQRNWGVKYSSNNVDNNGMLRFYLTPVRSYRRSKSATSRLKNFHTFAGNVLR